MRLPLTQPERQARAGGIDLDKGLGVQDLLCQTEKPRRRRSAIVRATCVPKISL
jgi:hypothetical protein